MFSVRLEYTVFQKKQIMYSLTQLWPAKAADIDHEPDARMYTYRGPNLEKFIEKVKGESRMHRYRLVGLHVPGLLEVSWPKPYTLNSLMMRARSRTDYESIIKSMNQFIDQRCSIQAKCILYECKWVR